MKYFHPNEFQGYYEQLDDYLKEVLDDFRFHWGDTVFVSPAPGAVGRNLGSTSSSGHNIDKWGKVMAVDLFPKSMMEPADFKRAFECATEAGALGFGVYPDWNPTPGIHIDVVKRPGRDIGNPARWSAFKINGKQVYFGIDKAFNM